STAATCAALNAAGFDPGCAPTVGQALGKLERGFVPAASIVDMRLPDASGGLLLRRIHRDKLPTKVAVVTGLPNPQNHPDLIRFPPHRIFQKPLDLLQLLDWLSDLT